MAKLYFRYSAMDAGKTLDLMKVAYNYNDRGQNVLILTSSIDNRAGLNKIRSRIGFDREAISTNQHDDLYQLISSANTQAQVACILVDEINFFTTKQIDQLSEVVDYLNIPVICYGLRSDYCGRPFASSAHLLAIADSLEELKTICHCGRKATFNMLVRDQQVIKAGDSIVIDDDNLASAASHYVSVCRLHWKENRYN